MNIYKSVISLAKGNKYQNLLVVSKEINGIRLFRNTYNFSRLQEIFINYLYMFDIINKDMITDKISKKVLEDEIYWDAYMLWRREEKYKDKKSKDSGNRMIHLVAGKVVTLPKRGNKNE
jgi:hypothetical protein